MDRLWNAAVRQKADAMLVFSKLLTQNNPHLRKKLLVPVSSRETDGLDLCLLKCSPRTNSNSVIWELVKI